MTTIILRFGNRDDALVTFGMMTERYTGDDVIVTFTDDDDIDDDEVQAEDVLAVLEEGMKRADSPEAALAAMQRARVRLGDNQPEFVSALDMVIRTIESVDEHIEPDPAPPRGLTRPSATGIAWLDEPRIKPTDNSPRARQIKRIIVDTVRCARCKAAAGNFCQSKGANFGLQHVHQARIDSFYAQQG